MHDSQPQNQPRTAKISVSSHDGVRSVIKRYLFVMWEFVKCAVVFLCVYVVVNWWRAPTMPDAPQLAYQDASGQLISLTDQSHHRAVLVYFWATWCHVCRYTSPNVQAVHELGHPVLSVAVSSGTDSEIVNYMQSHDYRFATMNDDSGAQFAQWQGQVTPSFVIVKDGRAVQSFTGVAPLWSLRARLWWADLSPMR